jgi:hypothetical protein
VIGTNGDARLGRRVAHEHQRTGSIGVSCESQCAVRAMSCAAASIKIP